MPANEREHNGSIITEFPKRLNYGGRAEGILSAITCWDVEQPETHFKLLQLTLCYKGILFGVFIVYWITDN